MIKNFTEMLDAAKAIEGKKAIIAGAQGELPIEAAILAKTEGLCDSILVGDADKIKHLLQSMAPEIADTFEIVDTGSDLVAACKESVRLAKENKGHVILKGKADTALLLKAVLDKEKGIRTSKVICDILAYEHPEKILFMGDGGINLLPDLAEKVAIVNSGAQVARAFGIEDPKVALICAVEKVNPKMPATIDAALISAMNKRGQIKGCTVDGPLAFDNAIDEEACKIKGINSPVGGKADVMIVPNIEAGNIYGKMLTYYCNYRVAHAVMGTKVPILIPSRADSGETKMLCMAMGLLVSNN